MTEKNNRILYNMFLDNFWKKPAGNLSVGFFFTGFLSVTDLLYRVIKIILYHERYHCNSPTALIVLTHIKQETSSNLKQEL
jgi:hypothetical protein